MSPQHLSANQHYHEAERIISQIDEAHDQAPPGMSFEEAGNFLELLRTRATVAQVHATLAGVKDFGVAAYSHAEMKELGIYEEAGEDPEEWRGRDEA